MTLLVRRPASPDRNSHGIMNMRLNRLRKNASSIGGRLLDRQMLILRDLAEASEKYGPAITAEVALGKANLVVDEGVDGHGCSLRGGAD